MGCNCGKKNKQQKLQQQVRSVQTKNSINPVTPGGVSAAEYLKEMKRTTKNRK